MADQIRKIPDTPDDDQPDTIATPEGDNEFAPDQPLRALPDDAEQDPRGSEPDDEYKNDGHKQDS